MFISIKTEIKTWLLTGRALLAIVFIVGGFVAYSCLGISELKSNMRGFQFSESMIADDDTVIEMLNMPLVSKESGVNSLLMEKQRIENMLNSLSPKQAFEFCEEVGLYLLPLIMTVIGAVTICDDCTGSVMRIRASREGKWRYFCAKQLVMIGMSLGLSLLSMLIYRVISKLTYNRAKSIITSKFIETSSSGMVTSGNWLIRVLFFMLCIVFSLVIGFSLGYVFKSSIIPVCVIGIVWYFNMLPTAYEPKNAVYNIAGRIYSFSGVAPNGITAEIPLLTAFLIVLLTFILAGTALVFAWGKRSVYK